MILKNFQSEFFPFLEGFEHLWLWIHSVSNRIFDKTLRCCRFTDENLRDKLKKAGWVLVSYFLQQKNSGSWTPHFVDNDLSKHRKKSFFAISFLKNLNSDVWKRYFLKRWTKNSKFVNAPNDFLLCPLKKSQKMEMPWLRNSYSRPCTRGSGKILGPN